MITNLWERLSFREYLGLEVARKGRCPSLGETLSPLRSDVSLLVLPESGDPF